MAGSCPTCGRRLHEPGGNSSFDAKRARRMVKVPNKLVEILAAQPAATASTAMLEDAFLACGMAAASVMPGLGYLVNLGIVVRVNTGLWRLTPAADNWGPIV